MATLENQELKSLAETIQDDRKESRKIHAEWRNEAREMFRFYAGDQWPIEDKAVLELNERPTVTFNRVGPFIDAVIGTEINDRKEVRYIPRTLDDTGVNEVLTGAAQWVRDQCDAEDEETDAFKDTLICGMGWTETFVDFTDDPNGQIKIEKIPPLEMEWDSQSQKQNLADARWVARERWMDRDEILQRWPKAELVPVTEELFDDLEASPHDATRAWMYRKDVTWYDAKINKWLIIHYQWKELGSYYRAYDPNTGTAEFVPGPIFNERFKDTYDEQEIPYVKQSKWEYKQGFLLGKQLLEESDIPQPKWGDVGFSFKCITGKRDQEEKEWFGMMRSMKDPQEWSNKFFSQFMHIVNSNAKGGVMIEEGAVDNLRDLEAKWAKSNAVIQFNEGALTQGKVQERGKGDIPAGVDRMLQFAMSSIPDTAGVNLETLGLVSREQAAVLEQERKKAAYVVLSPLFNALRRYRKEQGRLLLHYIQEYISDGRLIRVSGEQGKKYVPLTKDDEVIEYDVIVDQADASPNQKQEVWAMLQNVLPAMVKAGIPVPINIMKYSPLPESFVLEWQKQVDQQQEQKVPEQVQQQMQEMGQQLQQLQQENQQLKDKKAETAEQLQLKRQEAEFDAQIDIFKAESENKRKNLELEYERQQTEQELEIERYKAEATIAIQNTKTQNDIKVAKVKAQGIKRPKDVTELLTTMKEIKTTLGKRVTLQ